MTITVKERTRTTIELAPVIRSAANTLPATSLHPVAIAIPLVAATYLVIAFWVTFAGGEASLDLAVVTLILVAFFGLIAGCGAYVRNVEPDRRTRSFREFLDGHVDVETGRITGHAALWQMATMPVMLAIGGSVILACAASAQTAAARGEKATVAAQASSVGSAPLTVVSGGVTLRSVSVDFPDDSGMFPGGAEADAINNNCLACHSAGMVLTQPRLSRADWQAEVDKMRNSYKAPVAAPDVPAIVDYLANLSSGTERSTPGSTKDR
jgi:hypothetical protein